jgi:hypothetical protein
MRAWDAVVGDDHEAVALVRRADAAYERITIRIGKRQGRNSVRSPRAFCLGRGRTVEPVG